MTTTTMTTTSTCVIVDALSTKQVKYNGGAGIGKFVMDDRVSKSESIQCHYDMVLVERIQGRPPTESGLFVPQADLPKLHLCRVIAYGPGKEEENGRIVPIEGLSVNDVVIAKNPWGIGPRDEETSDGKKLSYMRFQDIAAVIPGGLVPTDEE
jgi:co-chaperonin GroES (HSP10)